MKEKVKMREKKVRNVMDGSCTKTIVVDACSLVAHG